MPTKFATSKALYNKIIEIILEAYKFESFGTFEQYYCYFNWKIDWLKDIINNRPKMNNVDYESANNSF
jgi:DNA polymerase II small subunit/DNA polymerase delta subunit B